MPKSKGRRKPKSQRTHQAQPESQKHKESPTWYVALMFGVMGIGALVVILNYIGAVPGGTDSVWLYSGLGLIGVGFVMTLNYY
ncbi:MAG: cell division protein CrgA [Actinobacteria bacterium]|nr:cell division protein CrgA [Actinomycetota bacterium]